MLRPTEIASHAALAFLGLMAGFFYAFSVCVMPGLDRIDSGAAIEAMQGINEAVRNPVFFVTFFLAPAIAMLAAGITWANGKRGAAAIMALAAATYLALALVLTAVVNVPMNEALALVDPADADAARIWTDYSVRWTGWNTARTLTSLLAMLIFSLGMVMAARQPGHRS